MLCLRLQHPIMTDYVSDGPRPARGGRTRRGRPPPQAVHVDYALLADRGRRLARDVQGVNSLDPAFPLVMQTETIVLPAWAHLASVPATVNSWSSGWAWMQNTRPGGVGSAFHTAMTTRSGMSVAQSPPRRNARAPS